MTEQEAAQDFARRLFGSQPEPEPKDEPEPIDDEAEAKGAESKTDADSTEPEPADPAQEHNRLLGDLLRGGGAKREADEQFFRTLHPPAEEGKEDSE